MKKKIIEDRVRHHFGIELSLVSLASSKAQPITIGLLSCICSVCLIPLILQRKMLTCEYFAINKLLCD